jgi:hypothetical protein
VGDSSGKIEGRPSMNRSRKKVARRRLEHQFELGWLLGAIFKTVLPVWDSYRGKVPPEELESLDRNGDWPMGTALAVVNRFNKDKKLRNQIRESFSFHSGGFS